MNKMVISTRLYELLKQSLLAKINGSTYKVAFRLGVSYCDNSGQNLYLDGMYVDEDSFNYFCYNKDNRITCWPVRNGIQPLNERGQWRKEGRQEIKPAKFLMLILPCLSITDCFGNYVDRKALSDLHSKIMLRACELFADRIRGVNTPIEIEITGAIRTIYNTRPHDGSGYLQNSCMRPHSGHSCHNYAKFYDYVPKLKVVYKIDCGLLLFRALLWEEVFTDSGEKLTFLDRIYGTEAVASQLINQAIENGWAYRSFGNNRVIYKDRSMNVERPLGTMALNYLHKTGSPYVDTLCYLSQDYKGTWVLSNYRQARHCIQSTSGSTYDIYPVCCRCGNRNKNQALHEVDDALYCTDCLRYSCFECPACEEWHQNYRRVIVRDVYPDGICGECADELGYHKCRACCDYYQNDDMIQYLGRYYCNTCRTTRFGNCSHCGSLHTNPNLYTVVLDGCRVRLCDGCVHDHTFTRCQVCRENCVNTYASDVIPGMVYVCPTCVQRQNAYDEEQAAIYHRHCDNDRLTVYPDANQLYIPEMYASVRIANEGEAV